MKIDHQRLFVSPSASLLDAMKVIDNNSSQFALVVDENSVLLGTLTDGDIRRALLRGQTLGSLCQHAMNDKFRFFTCNDGYASMQAKMKLEEVRQMPVLNEEGKVLDLVFLDEFDKSKLPNSVVVMAGGLGKRLRPFTENCPKPMLPIGGKPMLEILLEQCIDCGFSNFYFSVNYLKNQVIDYFQSGDRWGVNIDYLEESRPLGTAGSLRLLSDKVDQPFLVLNGDVLTRLDYSKLLSFHDEHGASATMCVRDYQVNIPFGVVKTDGFELSCFDEKPSYNYLVNAGVYVVNPGMLSFVQENEVMDMPSLLGRLQKAGQKVSVCPVHEYWIDVGRPEALQQAYLEWSSGVDQ